MLFFTVPSPNVTITIDQNSSIISARSNLTLTCVIELPPEVDTNITLNINWTGPAGNTLPGSSTPSLMAGIPTSRYERILAISPADADQFGNYSCTATVNSGPPSIFITASEGSATLTIIGKDNLLYILHKWKNISNDEISKRQPNKVTVPQFFCTIPTACAISQIRGCTKCCNN